MLPKPIWYEDGKVLIIEQTKLPALVEVLEIATIEEMWDAIKRLAVRGAPAIGLAGAFGVYLGAKQWLAETSTEDFLAMVKRGGAYLDSSRPTAVNLHWAVVRMAQTAEKLLLHFGANEPQKLVDGLLAECETMLAEDIAACRAIGEYGADILSNIEGFEAMLTHCNAGALATSMYGTALAPAYIMQERGKPIYVYSDETRPLLQGSRLTAWELSQSGIGVTTICDNMAGVVMAERKVQAVIVGADRIAANGDTANKIGTYSVAVLAAHHQIPFYVAAPLSTVDFALNDGSGIPIEQRHSDEVKFWGERQTAPDEAAVYNPAFDVTPNQYIAGIITEKGVAYPPFAVSLAALREDKPVLPKGAAILQQEVVKYAKKMVQEGLVKGSFGNISIYNREYDLLAITPSGRDYGEMTAEDICLVNGQGKEIAGWVNKYPPSSELMLHTAIYQARTDVQAVVHFHGVYSTVYACSTEPLRPLVSEMMMLAPNDIPKADYALPGSEELAAGAVEALGTGYGCLLANHGAVTAADNLKRAYFLAQILEEGAEVAYLSRNLPVSGFNEEEKAKLYQKMNNYAR